MSGRTLLVFLHGLGCSARSWNRVVGELDDAFECLALDLPGHGEAAASSELTVEQTAERVIRQIGEREPDRWALIGHSMGGRIAALVAARAETGRTSLPAPLALVLVAASPLTPEPMDDDTRARMIGWCADGPVPPEAAHEFIDANTAASLDADTTAKAVADVCRVSRVAWLAWLERGSREDWSHEVPQVHTPALVVAGAADGPLGVEGQRALVLPRSDTDQVVTVDSAAHLIMLEQPVRLAGLIAQHVSSITDRLDRLPHAYAQLFNSDRVSARTRSVLIDRMAAPSGQVFDERQRSVLTALVARLVPGGDEIDLAARLEQNLAAGVGDGWRFAELPVDVEAWRRGLDAADGFAQLPTEQQDEWIERAASGELGSDDEGRLNPTQLPLWLEDVRAEAARIWISHPATMARIGYDGFANGGDGARKQGYLRVGAGEREGWQPA